MNPFLISALAKSMRDFADNLEAALEKMGREPLTGDIKMPAAAVEPPVQPASVVPVPPAPAQPEHTPPPATNVQPFPAAVATPRPPATAPVVQPDLTLTQVQEVIGGYIKDLDENGQNQILQLIQSYGVDRVSSLPPEVYSDFLLKAKEIADA